MVSRTYLIKNGSSPSPVPAWTEEGNLSTPVCDFIILSAGAKYSQLQMDSVGAAMWLCQVLHIAK